METKIYDFLQKDAVQIRTAVFMEEQQFKNEFDETDQQCRHLVIYDMDMPIAACRVIRQGKRHYVIGRIAVVQAYRGKGIGRIVINEAEKYIKKEGGAFVHLSAQVRVQAFYEKMGYVCEGDTYMDEHCLHIQMKKDLFGSFGKEKANEKSN